MRLKLGGLILCAVALGGRGRAADFAGTIILGRPTDSSITANVLSPTAASVYLEYGTQPGAYAVQTAATALAANQPLEVNLAPGALLPNTRYYYRLRHRGPAAVNYDASAEYSFMTQRAPGSTFTFCIQGDSHPERGRTAFDAGLYTRHLQQIAADRPDFFIALGDDFSVDTLPSYSATTVEARYTLQRPYFDLVARNTPLFLTNGNHEQAARYLLNGTANNVAVWAQNARHKHFPLPAPDAFYAGNAEPVEFIGPLRNYYAWTWGDALFVVIDFYWGSPVCVDNLLGVMEHAAIDMWDITLGDAQYAWLKRTLEQSKAKQKFVFAHHALGTGRGGVEVASLYEWGGKLPNGTNQFAQKRPGWELPIHQLMAKNGVTIFFQGHDHNFAYQQLDGVVYQTLPYPADPNYSLSFAEAYKSGTILPASGYGRVTVSPTGVKVDYVRNYLAADEGPGKKSGATDFSYTIGMLTAPTPVPVITLQPVAQTITLGGSATFAITAISSLAINYQWRRDGTPLAGATSSALTIPQVQTADTGSYTVVISTTAGTVTSTPVALSLGSSRLINLSVRSTAGAGNQTLIVGLVVGAGEPLPLLLRAIGPTLGAFGVTGVLADPVLTLSSGSGALVATNDNWGTATNVAQISAAASQSGAFALPGASLDAALLASLASGSYTAQVTGQAAATGVALMEAYDTAANATSARLVNISARTQVGTGGSVLIAGFVVQGNAPKQLLIRGVGPTLSAFGVTGVLADPLLTLYRDGSASPIQQNDNWLAATNVAQIGLKSALVGAFVLPAASRDAALLVTLDPGTYTAQVSGVGGTTGVALVEIYEVP